MQPLRNGSPGLPLVRSGIAGLPLVYVMPAHGFEVVVGVDHLLSWGVGPEQVHAAAMANLAEAIQGLVHHMRSEQQMIRDWVDGQADQQREIKRLLELMVREKVNR